MDATALFEAIVNNERTRAERLVSKGVDVNACVFGQIPLLHAVIAHGKKGRVKLLLSLGADPNISDSAGFRALHRALHQENYEIAALLLEAGADPSLPCPNGWPALLIPEGVDKQAFAHACLEHPSRVPDRIWPFGRMSMQGRHEHHHHVHGPHCQHD